MILLTDGEENGLLGAEAFVRERAAGPAPRWSSITRRGVRPGTPSTFRTTSPNSTLLAVLSRAPGASADSGSEAVFETLSNDTDFTVFSGSGMYGYDTAIVGRGAYYHSPLDDPAHLSADSLQQMGETSLAAARELAGLDLATLRNSGSDVVITLPWGLVRHPAALELPLALGTLVLAGVVVALERRRRTATLPRAALSVVVALGVLVAAGLAGSIAWQVALLLDPGQASAIVGEPYRPVPYQVAMLLAGLGVVLVGALLRRPLGAAALAAGALVALASLGVLLALALPGAAVALVWPTFFAALGSIVAALLPGRTVRGVAVAASLVPAAVVLGPTAWIGFEVGLGLGGAACVVVLAAFLLLALPIDRVRWTGIDPCAVRGGGRSPAARGRRHSRRAPGQPGGHNRSSPGVGPLLA